VGLAKGGGDKKSDHRVKRKPSDPPTLAEAGIDKNLAHEGRKLGALSEREFERRPNPEASVTHRLVPSLKFPLESEPESEPEPEPGVVISSTRDGGAAKVSSQDQLSAAAGDEA
jgi:hypothetical protein